MRPFDTSRKMKIKDLHINFKELVKKKEIFLYDKYNSHDIFIEFRKSNKGILNNEEEQYLINLLSSKKEQWFVPHVLRVMDSFSENLMKKSIEAAIKIQDPSYNNNFLSPCKRVFDLKVNDYLNLRFQSANKKDKIGILRAFYWVRDRRTWVMYPDKSEEVYGRKFFWNGSSFTGRENERGENRMSEDEFNTYCELADSKKNERIEILLNTFQEESDIEIKYRISLNLPKEIEKYPKHLTERAKLFLDKKDEIPENISDLIQIQKVSIPFLRSILMKYFNWKNKRLRRKGLITLKDK